MSEKICVTVTRQDRYRFLGRKAHPRKSAR